MFLNIVVFICRSTHMALIIWQSYAILPCEMLQRVNTLIKYLWEYSNFKCAHLTIWAVRKDRKWILKEKLSGKFPLDIGFYILWEQVLCHLRNVYGIRSVYRRSQPEISLLQLSSIWRITIVLSNWLCNFVTGQNSWEVPTNYLGITNCAFVIFLHWINAINPLYKYAYSSNSLPISWE